LEKALQEYALRNKEDIDDLILNLHELSQSYFDTQYERGGSIKKTKDFEITEIVGYIYLYTPYNKSVVDFARALNGKWTGSAWKFDSSMLEYVKEKLINVYGYYDESDTEFVDIVVKLNNKIVGESSTFDMFGQQIAKRWNKDSSVKLADNVFVTKGRFLSSGGSPKKPKITFNEDTEILVKNIAKKHYDWSKQFFPNDIFNSEFGIEKTKENPFVIQYADKIMKITGSTDPTPFLKNGKMIEKAIIEKDVVKLRHWLNGVNPQMNKLFTQITGLPSKTQKEANESIRSLNPEQWDSHFVKKTKEEIAKKAQDSKILDKRITYNGQIITKQTFIEKLINLGYSVSIADKSQNSKTGKIQYLKKPQYRILKKEEDSNRIHFFIITKAEYDYANELINAKKENIKPEPYTISPLESEMNHDYSEFSHERTYINDLVNKLAAKAQKYFN